MRWLATTVTIHLLASLVEAATMNITNTRAMEDNRYDKAHYLPESHSFDPRDGWEVVNISNLNYKYHASSQKDHSFHRALRRSSKYKETHEKASNTSTGVLGTVVQSFTSVFAGLVGKGSTQGVIITW